MVTIENVQALICHVGSLEQIGADDVLGESGFSSMKALELLLEMETEFDLTIPDDRFITARTARELYEVVISLTKEHHE